MKDFKISPDSKGEEIAPFALMLHNLVRLPLTMRSLNNNGVRIEDGKIVDYNYTGPTLEEVLKENKVIKTIAKDGVFKGKSVVVAPVRDDVGNVVAAIGISDTYGAIDFIECFCRSPIIEDVERCLTEKRNNK